MQRAYVNLGMSLACISHNAIYIVSRNRLFINLTNESHMSPVQLIGQSNIQLQIHYCIRIQEYMRRS